MGQEFAFAFDIAVIVLLAVFAFVGLKKGFAKVVLGLAATVAAFAVAMLLSGPIASAIYKNTIEKNIEEQIDKVDGLGEISFGNIVELNFEKVKINGTPVGDVKLDYAGTRKAAVDLSRLDLSDTGLKTSDLAMLGISEDFDLSSLNAKTAELSMDDVEEYGLGKIAVAQYIAVNIAKQPVMKSFSDVAKNIGKYVPGFADNSAADSAGVSSIRAVALKMLDMKVSFKSAVMNGIIEPNCVLLIRTIVFGIIFILVNLLLRILTSVAKLINKIPVIGKINAFLGLVMGLVEGLFTVFVVCVITRMIVSLCGPNSILFNQAAIDSTFLFKTFYNFDFLNFLK